MFGLDRTEAPYDQAAEWTGIIDRLYASEQPFDHDGAYYSLKGAASRPAPLSGTARRF